MKKSINDITAQLTRFQQNPCKWNHGRSFFRNALENTLQAHFGLSIDDNKGWESFEREYGLDYKM